MMMIAMYLIIILYYFKLLYMMMICEMREHDQELYAPPQHYLVCFHKRTSQRGTSAHHSLLLK